MLGPLAALAGGGQVGDLDGGGGSAACGGARQVLCGTLVLQVQAGAAGIGLHPEVWERERESTVNNTHRDEWLPIPGNRWITVTPFRTLPN